MKRKDQVILLLDAGEEMSLKQITEHIVKFEKLEKSETRYVGGSVASLLAGMVKSGILEYAATKTKRGGHIYKLKPVN